MNNTFEIVREIQPYVTDRNWMYAPRTYLLDSWEPILEEIYLPISATKPGTMKINLKNDKVAKFGDKNKIKQLKSYFYSKNNKIKIDGQDFILDLRQKNPENFAHALTNHLPISLCVRNLVCSNQLSGITLLFPRALPQKIHDLFLNLGFDVILNDDDVFGNIIEYSVDPWIAIRGVRHEIMRNEFLNSDFSSKIQSIAEDKPKNIFLSRKDTRCLINESAVEGFLTSKGFTKVYLEEFDVFEQIALVALAENIVAIHGAGLAPLLFRAGFDLPPVKLIEIFSPGHLTNVYRVICHQVTGKWCGIRGKLEPSIIKHAYIVSNEINKFDFFWKFGHKNFEIDLDSLKLAIKELEI